MKKYIFMFVALFSFATMSLVSCSGDKKEQTEETSTKEGPTTVDDVKSDLMRLIRNADDMESCERLVKAYLEDLKANNEELFNEFNKNKLVQAELQNAIIKKGNDLSSSIQEDSDDSDVEAPSADDIDSDVDVENAVNAGTSMAKDAYKKGVDMAKDAYKKGQQMVEDAYNKAGGKAAKAAMKAAGRDIEKEYNKAMKEVEKEYNKALQELDW